MANLAGWTYVARKCRPCLITGVYNLQLTAYFPENLGENFQIFGELKALTCFFLYPGKIWMFPKMVVPPNHPILMRFSIRNHPFGGIPIFGNTPMDRLEGRQFPKSMNFPGASKGLGSKADGAWTALENYSHT